MDSRLKSGTGVLFFLLFLLPWPSSATSVIIRPKVEDGDDLTSTRGTFLDRFGAEWSKHHSLMADQLLLARLDLVLYSPFRGLFLFTDLLPTATATARSGSVVAAAVI